FFVFFNSNVFGHPDNYIPANSLVTPSHIVPEWYFLPFYAILRSIPNKTLGVVAMFASILVLYALPFLYNGRTATASFQPFSRVLFWMFVASSLILGWVGGNPVEYPYYQFGQIATLFYFFYFFIFTPAFSTLESAIFYVELSFDLED